MRMGTSLMHGCVVFLLVIGLAVLLLIGVLRVMRDLLSDSVFAAPLLENEEPMQTGQQNAVRSPLLHTKRPCRSNQPQ